MGNKKKTQRPHILQLGFYFPDIMHLKDFNDGKTKFLIQPDDTEIQQEFSKLQKGKNKKLKSGRRNQSCLF